MAASVVTGGWPASAAVPFEIQSLDGSGNNIANPTWGRSGGTNGRIEWLRQGPVDGTLAATG